MSPHPNADRTPSSGLAVNSDRRGSRRQVTVEALTVHADQRGSVFEPLEAEALPDQRNVHVVVTEPGAVRGNHLHPRGTETLVIHGPALFRCREEGELADTEIPAGAVYRFTIPP